MDLRSVWMTLCFVLSIPELLAAQEKAQPVDEVVSVVAIAADSKWLERHQVHVAIDMTQHALPFFIQKAPFENSMHEDGPIWVKFDGQSHRVVVTPNAQMELFCSQLYVISTPKRKKTLCVFYTLFGPKGYDWRKLWVKPTDEELSELLHTKLETPKK